MNAGALPFTEEQHKMYNILKDKYALSSHAATQFINEFFRSKWIFADQQLPDEMKTTGGSSIGISNHVLVWDGHTKYVAFFEFTERVWIPGHFAFTNTRLISPIIAWQYLPANP